MAVKRTAAAAGVTVVCAWFALGIRQAHDTQRAGSILSSSASLSTAQQREVASLLRSARQLNPDADVDILDGRLALARGDRRQAERVLERVARREPENVEAWLWLVKSAPDARTAADALRHIALLVPKVPAR